jgi:hypothetical protein
MTELKTIGRRPAAKKTHASATSLDRLIWTFRFALLLAIFCTAPKAGAQVKTTSSNTGVVDQGSKDVLPPKPATLTQVPVAKIESDDGSPYSRQMVSYLVSLFNRAGRPRITEGENFDYVIRASVVNPPELEEYSSGHIANGKLLKEIGGKFLKPRLFSGGVENIDFNNTNLMTVTHCGVELRLLNKDKEIIVLRTAQVGSTNSLRALSLELNGISSGDPSGDVDTFKRKVSKGTVLQALVNLAAYSAATNFLPAADVHFVQAKPTQPTKALPVSSTNVAPPWQHHRLPRVALRPLPAHRSARTAAQRWPRISDSAQAAEPRLPPSHYLGGRRVIGSQFSSPRAATPWSNSGQPR